MKNLLTLGLLLVAAAGCGNGVTVAEGKAACATATACGIWQGDPNNPLFGAGITGCTEFVQEVNDPAIAGQFQINADQVSCLAKAGANCGLARKCLNAGQTPSPCAGDSGQCDGNVLDTCSPITGSNGNNGTRKFDCGSAGLKCIVANNTARCGVDTCSGYLTMCKDNSTTLQYCVGGIETDTDCGDTAEICVPGQLGAAHCSGNSTNTCTGINGTALRCDGSVVVFCDDNREARRDCSRVHETCVGDGSSARCGLADDCDPQTTAAICTGNTLKFCNKGKNDTINCGANGFTGCDASGGGRCETNQP